MSHVGRVALSLAHEKLIIMPYKDPNDPRRIAQKKAYYQRTKEGRYERYKHNIVKHHKSEKYKAYVKKRYESNKEVILERQKISYKKHIEKRHAARQKDIDLLSDTYVKNQLVKNGFTFDMIKDNKELIETKRILIKTKRLLKQNDYEKH